MEHEDKIKEIEEIEGKLTETYFNREPYWSIKVKDILKEYGNYIREKTIEECIGCVPEEQQELQYCHAYNQNGETITDTEQIPESIAFNICRQQTLKELSNLKK